MPLSIPLTTAILVLISLTLETTTGLEKPTRDHIPKNRRILEHAESGKCLTVSDDYRLFLEKCNYDLEEPLIAGVFHVVKSNRGGHVMKWATQPIPGAIEGCLRSIPPNPDTSTSVENSRQELQLVECDIRDPSLNWQFVQVDGTRHLLKKFPAGPCVVADSHKEGAGVHAVTCNENDVEQIWNICENDELRKCEVYL